MSRGQNHACMCVFARMKFFLRRHHRKESPVIRPVTCQAVCQVLGQEPADEKLAHTQHSGRPPGPPPGCPSGSWARSGQATEPLPGPSVGVFTTSSLGHPNAWPRLRTTLATLGRARRREGGGLTLHSCPLDASMSPPCTCFPPEVLLTSGTSSGATSLGHLLWLIPRREFTALLFLGPSSANRFIPISPAESSLGQESGPTHLCPTTAQHSEVLSECVRNNKARELSTVCRSQSLVIQGSQAERQAAAHRPGGAPAGERGEHGTTHAGPPAPKSLSSVHGRRAQVRSHLQSHATHTRSK